MRFQVLLTSISFIILSFNNAYSAELDYALGVDVGAYSNVRQVENPADNEISESVRGSIFINENTADLIASVNLTTETTNYQKNIQTDFNQSDLFASALWTLSPNHYEWYFLDIYTQTARDLLQTNLPSNRQSVNALSTGPNFIWRFGKANTIRIEPRIENFRYEINELSNNRLNTTFQWIHAPSKNTTYALLSKYEQTKYTASNISESDFDQFDANLRFTYTNNKNSIELEGGIIKIESNSFGDKKDNQYRLLLVNQRTRSSVATIEVNKYVTDTSRSITSLNTVDTVATGSDIDAGLLTTSNDLFVSERTLVDYNRRFGEVELAIGMSRGTDDYFFRDSLDRDINNIYVQTQWDNDRNSEVNFQYSMRELEYSQQVSGIRIDDDTYGQLDYRYRINKNMFYIISYSIIERDSTATGVSFEDKRILFSIEYITRDRNS